LTRELTSTVVIIGPPDVARPDAISASSTANGCSDCGGNAAEDG
jgi:hypothetical protein